MKTLKRITVPSKTINFLLTWAEHDMLCWREEMANNFKPGKRWLADILTFKGSKDTSITAWNEMSGTNLTVTVYGQNEDALIAAVNLFSHPSTNYLKGLEQGTNGGDLKYPQGLPKSERKLMERGFKTGQQIGAKALTTGMTGTSKEWEDCQVIVQANNYPEK
jgi:hypothetical protein